MGIKNFYKFIIKYAPNCLEKKRIGNYEGKILGVDANLILYQFLASNNNVNNYSKFYNHIMEIITCSYKYNIKFIFVFDGKIPDIKKKIVNNRKLEREKATNDLINGNYTSETKNKILLKSLHLNRDLINDVKYLLTICGIPYINAPYEADSQLASMSKNNIIDGIITSDYDTLVFGGKNIIIDFFGCDNLNGWNRTHEININNLLQSLNISYESFVELCILMGSDYSDKTLYSFDYIYKNIVKFKNFNGMITNNKIKIPENLDMNIIKKYFTDSYWNPEMVNFNFHEYDKEKIIEFCNKYQIHNKIDDTNIFISKLKHQ